ncbi:hypothetical protein [Spongiactinospora sp. 9N601]|uniref:hypothetical protein n=1 Tax=Spongiactinospora sp. 9N601 TaxID=3375149 RepID=UPI0037B3C71B
MTRFRAIPWRVGRSRRGTPRSRGQWRLGAASGRFAEVPEGLGVESSLKPADEGDGVIVRLRGTGPLRLAVPAGAVLDSSPLEENGAPLPLDGGTVMVELGRYQTRTLRIRP